MNLKTINFFYRFLEDEDKEVGLPAINLLLCCSKKGFLVKKGKITWNTRFFILKEDESRLYYYENEASSHPKQIIELSSGKLDVNGIEKVKKGLFCFRILDQKGKEHICGASSAQEQEEWITSIAKSGAHVQEDSLNSVSSTIFEFTVLDINTQPVNLSQFTNQVCLIVNVASE